MFEEKSKFALDLMYRCIFSNDFPANFNTDDRKLLNFNENTNIIFRKQYDKIGSFLSSLIYKLHKSNKSN